MPTAIEERQPRTPVHTDPGTDTGQAVDSAMPLLYNERGSKMSPGVVEGTLRDPTGTPATPVEYRVCPLVPTDLACAKGCSETDGKGTRASECPEKAPQSEVSVDPHARTKTVTHTGILSFGNLPAARVPIEAHAPLASAQCAREDTAPVGQQMGTPTGTPKIAGCVEKGDEVCAGGEACGGRGPKGDLPFEDCCAPLKPQAALGGEACEGSSVADSCAKDKLGETGGLVLPECTNPVADSHAAECTQAERVEVRIGELKHGLEMWAAVERTDWVPPPEPAATGTQERGQCGHPEGTNARQAEEMGRRNYEDTMHLLNGRPFSLRIRSLFGRMCTPEMRFDMIAMPDQVDA